MGRKRKLYCGFLAFFITTILCLLGVSGCTARLEDNRVPTDISLRSIASVTKASDPDEDKIKDANIFVFSSDGFMERSEFIDGDRCSLPLVKGRDYDIFVCVNFGYRLNIRSLDELMSLEFHLAYPDDYSTGMPMCGYVRGARAGDDIEIRMKRLMAAIKLNIDRSRLDKDVTMNVHSISIGNCPKRCRVFSESKVNAHEECFSVGFSRGNAECSALNHGLENGKSAEIVLYMLENLQGMFPREISDDSDKVFKESELLSEVCSYIEMELEYSSMTHFSDGGYLRYRFYLGESLKDMNVERNCVYHITVTPENDGLADNGWRVDKTSLSDAIGFKMEPEGYLEAEIGEVIHVGCTFSPPGARFDIGINELEEDRMRGIYDYVVDEDGHGVTLTIRGLGTGMVYMEAGEPINQAGLLYIHVKEK